MLDKPCSLVSAEWKTFDESFSILVRAESVWL